MATGWAKRIFLNSLGALAGGELVVECFERSYRFGHPSDLAASLVVHEAGFAAPPSVKAEERILAEAGALPRFSLRKTLG